MMKGIYKTDYGNFKDMICLTCKNQLSITGKLCGYIGASISSTVVIKECPGYEPFFLKERHCMEFSKPKNNKPKDQTMKMDFYTALKEVSNGRQITRLSWPGKEVVFMQNRFLSLKKIDGTIHTLLVSEGDMSGDDWIVTDKDN